MQITNHIKNLSGVMIHKKILVIAPYPITRIEHGGQKRAMAIFNFYKSKFSSAKYVGVFHRGQYPDWGEDDLPLGDPELIKLVDDNPYASELVTGAAIDKDIHVRSNMAKLLMEFNPEVIHIEQPFPYIGLKVLLDELNMHPLIIFGSQNIEYKLKQRIYSGLNVSEKYWKPAIKEIKDLEFQFSREADIVIAVNDSDVAAHKKMGAKKCLMVPNGIEKNHVSRKETEYWKEFKYKNMIEKTATFVGSGHPPNWLGFLEAIGDDTSFLPKNAKILVAGGTADYFNERYKDKKSYARFWKGIKLLGKLEEDRLTALLDQSDVILLPIPKGGGSNLKTAEAILSGKKVVATPFAFNGFEKFRHLPNIWVADSKDNFQDFIIKALNAPYVKRTKYETELANSVQWNSVLLPLEKKLRLMLRFRILFNIFDLLKSIMR